MDASLLLDCWAPILGFVTLLYAGIVGSSSRRSARSLDASRFASAPTLVNPCWRN